MPSDDIDNPQDPDSLGEQTDDRNDEFQSSPKSPSTQSFPHPQDPNFHSAGVSLESTGFSSVHPTNGSFTNHQFDWPAVESPMCSSIDTSHTFDHQSTDTGLVEDIFAISPTSIALLQPSFRTGGFNWLDFDQDFGSEPFSLQPIGQVSIPQSWPLDTDQRVIATSMNVSSTEDSMLDDTGSTGNNQGARPATHSSALAWPFDQANDSTSKRCNLPPLSEILGGRWLSNQPQHVGRTSMQGFIHILSQSPLPELATLHDSDSIHAFCELSRLVELYFARFHDVQAIIHRASWSMSRCPPALLTAIACIGALISDRESDKDIALALSEICSSMITWMGASDTKNYSDISYLNAHCLYQIYCLGSGNRHLYQDADRSRGLLIGGLRGIGLLRPRSAVNLGEIHERIPVSENEQVVFQEWREWIAREAGRRSAWAAFEYDCSLCTLTSRRGVVDLSELPSLLPCPESIWNAPSAQAWLALMSRLEPENSRPNTSVLLKLTLAGRELPPFLGSWAKRLCSQVLGRLLWDLWQLEVVAMPDYLGFSSIVTAHQEPKRSLLKGLNHLVDSLAAPSSTSDLISYK